LAGRISPGIAFTDQGFYFEVKAGMLLGGPHHSLETGILAFTPSDFGPFILLGYRYKAHKGFLFRIGTGIKLRGADEFFLLPGVSLGYAF